MSITTPRSARPEPPRLPIWAQAFGYLAAALYCFGFYTTGGGPSLGLTFAALPGVVWITALAMHQKTKKRYELELLQWRIKDSESRISYHEKAIAEGKPWFDDDDSEEWKFEQKYAIRQAQDRLSELQIELDERLKK